MDFIYERRKLPNGVKLEIITGGANYRGRVWREIAMQIYCENGKDGFREVGHFKSGAPFLFGADERISVSHTEGCLAVATIRVAPDTDLAVFSPATALGVDVESADRDKVLKLREKFLTEEEMAMIPADDLQKNIIAWTCKEAMLKAYLEPGIDWHRNITINVLPSPEEPGKGTVLTPSGPVAFTLTTLPYENYLLTIATHA